MELGAAQRDEEDRRRRVEHDQFDDVAVALVQGELAARVHAHDDGQDDEHGADARVGALLAPVQDVLRDAVAAAREAPQHQDAAQEVDAVLERVAQRRRAVGLARRHGAHDHGDAGGDQRDDGQLVRLPDARPLPVEAPGPLLRGRVEVARAEEHHAARGPGLASERPSSMRMRRRAG